MSYFFDRDLDRNGILVERNLDFLSPELLAACTRKVYAKGEIVVETGAVLKDVGFIESGSCRNLIYSPDGSEKSTFILDSAYGAIGLLEVFCLQKKIISTIVASEPTVILHLPLEYVYSHFMNDNSILRKCCFHFSRALLHMDDSSVLQYYSGKDKLIYHLTSSCRSVLKEGEIYTVPNSYEQIGSLLNLSSKTVYRSMQELMKDGLVSKRGKRITISYPQYIEMLAMIP